MRHAGAPGPRTDEYVQAMPPPDPRPFLPDILLGCIDGPNLGEVRVMAIWECLCDELLVSRMQVLVGLAQGLDGGLVLVESERATRGHHCVGQRRGVLYHDQFVACIAELGGCRCEDPGDGRVHGEAGLVRPDADAQFGLAGQLAPGQGVSRRVAAPWLGLQDALAEEGQVSRGVGVGPE